MSSTSQATTRGSERRLTKLWAALLAVGLTATLMAACNGSGDGELSPTVQPNGEGSPTPQAATSAACQALAGLKGYRYVTNLTLEIPEETVPFVEGQPTPVSTLTRDVEGRSYFEYSTDASFVAPDRFDALITAPTGSFNLIAIGDKSWITVGQQWKEIGTAYTVPYKPLDICTAIFSELRLDETQGKKETVNDVSARHYTLADTPSGQAMATIFGAESDMAILFQTMNVEVWVADEDGWPVRMDIQANGLYGDRRELKGHVRIELRDINDNDIKVEPPI